MQSLPHTRAAVGTLDGAGAGDHDQPYVSGRRPRSNATGPFTTRQYLHLLVLRSRVEAGLFATDDLRTLVENHSSVPGQEQARMNVQLARGTPLTLDIEAGAAESRLDLSALRITRLGLQTGVANTRVRLPEADGRPAVSVKGGVTDVTLDVPQGVAADIQVSDGLAGRQIDERRFRPVGAGHYRSPEYDTAPNRIDMQIELCLASLTIQ